MTPVDQFFKSLRDVGARNRDANWTLIGLGLGAAIVVTILLARWIRRWRSRRSLGGRIAAVVTASGMTRLDLDYLRRIAAAAGLPVLEVMTSLAPFEHATAAALASEAPSLRPVAGSAFERVRRLRKALGFSPLSPHLWLLSSRELVVGDPVAIGGGTGRIVEVNEACLAVDLPVAAVPAFGASATLTVSRADDARYFARVGLLAVEAPPGAGAGLTLRRAFFTHDEQPERRQQREYVRVRVYGAATVRSADPSKGTSGEATAPGPAEAPAAAATAAIAGLLVDVSAGGLALDLPIAPAGRLRRGARILCSFTLDEGGAFAELEARVVAAAAGPVAGVQHLRLSFTSLGEAARDRLAAAVVRQQQRPPPDDSARVDPPGSPRRSPPG
jgi:hypothetical protein